MKTLRIKTAVVTALMSVPFAGLVAAGTPAAQADQLPATGSNPAAQTWWYKGCKVTMDPQPKTATSLRIYVSVRCTTKKWLLNHDVTVMRSGKVIKTWYAQAGGTTGDGYYVQYLISARTVSDPAGSQKFQVGHIFRAANPDYGTVEEGVDPQFTGKHIFTFYT